MSAKNIIITTYVKGHARADDLKAIWKKTHKDFKGSYPDYCSILVHRGNQGSCSIPLRDLTNEEIDQKLPIEAKLKKIEKILALDNFDECVIDGDTWYRIDNSGLEWKVSPDGNDPDLDCWWVSRSELYEKFGLVEDLINTSELKNRKQG